MIHPNITRIKHASSIELGACPTCLYDRGGECSLHWFTTRETLFTDPKDRPVDCPLVGMVAYTRLDDGVLTVVLMEREEL